MGRCFYCIFFFLQDGKYSFSLQKGDDIFTLACPVTPFEDHSPADGPTGAGDDTRSNPPGAFLWTPPFYLAPPHYPHPVYRHEDPSQVLNNPHSPPTTRTSSAPQRTSEVAHSPPDSSQAEDQTSHQVPTLESQVCNRVHSPPAPDTRLEDLIPHRPDLHQRRETPTLGFSEGQRAPQFFGSDADVPLQVDGPPLQPLTDAFSQYYHYYHDPKIPLSDPPRDPNAAVEAFSQVDPHLSEHAVRLHGSQQSGGQTRPNQYQYLSEYPYSERDEAKRFALHISETIPKPHFPVFPQNLKSAHDVSELPHIHEKNNLPPFGSQLTWQSRTQSPEFRPSLPSAVVGARAEENLSRLGTVGDQPSTIPSLSPSYSLPQQPHYYVLYYPYHQMYDPDGHISTSSKDPSKVETLSSQESSFEKPLFPYWYRFHDYDASKAKGDKKEVQQTRTASTKSEFSDFSSSGVQRRAAVSGSNRRTGASEELEVNGKALEEKLGEEMRQEMAV